MCCYNAFKFNKILDKKKFMHFVYQWTFLSDQGSYSNCTVQSASTNFWEISVADMLQHAVSSCALHISGYPVDMKHNENVAYYFQVSGVPKLSMMSRMEVFSIYSTLKFLPRPRNVLSLVTCEEGPLQCTEGCSQLQDHSRLSSWRNLQRVHQTLQSCHLVWLSTFLFISAKQNSTYLLTGAEIFLRS